MKKEKVGIWVPEEIKADELQDFADWLNNWGDFNKHKRCLDELYTIGKEKRPNHITDFGRGYEKAIGDIIEKLGLDFKSFDKRTKTGFKKDTPKLLSQD